MSKDTYKDIVSKHNPKLIGDRCLVWSADYEHKPFKLTDKIHRKSRWVWIQVELSNEYSAPTKHIFKFERKPRVARLFFHKYPNPNFKIPPLPACDLWKLVEASEGSIKFTHNIPFSDVDAAFT